MPTIQSRSRTQIRQSIGLILGALDISDGSAVHRADDTGGTLTIRDNSLTFGSIDEHKGKWVVPVGTTDSGQIRKVEAFDPGARALTVSVAFSSQTDTNFEYELWSEDYPPPLVHDHINQALLDVTRKGMVPSDTTYVRTGQGIYAFDLPTAMVGVQEVFRRADAKTRVINNCDDSWSGPQTNVTVTADGEDKREGAASARLSIAAAFTTGQVANDTFGTLDIRGYTHVEGWAKSTVATDSDTLDLILNDTTSSGETLSVPALGADSWTYFREALSRPEVDSGVIRLRIDSNSDFGAAYLYFDDVRALRDRSEVWERIHPRFWSLNRDTRQIMFTPEGVDAYSLFRISGRRLPDLLTNDTDICEVDPNYVIHRTAASLLRLRPLDREKAALADRMEQLAQSAMARMETPRPGCRWIDVN